MSAAHQVKGGEKMVVRTRKRKEVTLVLGWLRSGGWIATIVSFEQLKEPKWCTAELGRLPDRHGAWP